MPLYNRMKMTEVKHVTTVQRSITSENRHKRWYGPMACWSPTKTNSSKHEQNIQFGLNPVENMHWHWFIYLWQQEHTFLGSGLYFIQITWFTYVFANICRVPKWVQFAGCSLDLAIQ